LQGGLQGNAVCCSATAAMCCSVCESESDLSGGQEMPLLQGELPCVTVCCHVLPCVAMYCSLSKSKGDAGGARTTPLLQIVFQSVSLCCRVLQRVAKARVVQLASNRWRYGVATISRLLKIIVSFAEYSLFYRALCKKSL